MNGTQLITSIDLINAVPSILQTAPQEWELVGVGYFGGAGDRSRICCGTTSSTAEWPFGT